MKVGLMGGTFDPIHYGHLVTAEEAHHNFGLEKVVFIPTGNPPHKDIPATPAEERYRMGLIATADNDHFEVSRIEVDRRGTSYTINTLKELSKIFPDAEFFFITGADAILEILTWKDASRVAKMATFIAATRLGYSLDKVDHVVKKLGFKANVKVLHVPALAISSTDIRKRANEGKSIRYLLPDDVCSYIYKRGFYR